jgi:hypothetical protein
MPVIHTTGTTVTVSSYYHIYQGVASFPELSSSSSYDFAMNYKGFYAFQFVSLGAGMHDAVAVM